MKLSAIVVGLLLCTMFMLSGCHSTTITTNQPAYGIPVDSTANHFFWGLIGDSVPTSGDISRAEVYKGVGDYILTLFTAGIYSPWTVMVWYSETKK